MFQPENRLKIYWDFIVLGTAIFGALEIPVSIIFNDTFAALQTFSSWFISVVFILDIASNFNTAYRTQGQTITDRSAIAIRYAKGWFFIDLIAAMPAGVILTVLRVPASSLWHLLRVNHLLKLPRSSSTLKRLGSSINPAILRLSLLVFWVLLAAHIVSCGWIYITGNPDALDQKSLYVKAFYWTITTLTTIGYGDITPSGNAQIAFVIFIELLGAGMYGLIIGNIANLIANIDVAKTQYTEKLEKINTFLKYKNIPNDLQRKINDYYNYLWESRRGYDESAVLTDLPAPLKVSVALVINKEIIEKVPIFENASDDLIREIILNLTPVVFTPGDNIVTAGEIGFDMYFISKGAVDVVSADERTRYATLSASQFFGEIALLLSAPRTATIKAKEYCDLYRLDKDSFDRVLSRHPDFAENIQELAKKRRSEIEEMSAGQDQETDKEESSEAPTPPPADIRAIRQTSGISLSWSAGEVRNGVAGTGEAGAAGNLSYDVIKKNPDTGKWVFLAKESSETSCTDQQFVPGRANVYRVRTVSGKRHGPWSRPVSVS